MLPLPVTADIFGAQARLRPFLAPTPMRASAWLGHLAGAAFYLKLESLNLTNSFKIRGAFNALLRLVERHPGPSTRPVIVTPSAGNHGRAMACAAERLGVPLYRANLHPPPLRRSATIMRHRRNVFNQIYIQACSLKGPDG